ncbi:Protein of unknown function [Pyronema omphalodes CBS 100304]|uniref:Uncharacterized protein n=1 Tax=Pyronema omphalodes (strain CBS 100304) TaxID=1076935 RepID=U4LEK9_PYROM|nr:Protein of unknown function [Pyronema omphalodes CBS 100304]
MLQRCLTTSIPLFTAPSH